jgi:hypothetical protein
MVNTKDLKITQTPERILLHKNHLFTLNLSTAIGNTPTSILPHSSAVLTRIGEGKNQSSRLIISELRLEVSDLGLGWLGKTFLAI